MSSNLEEKLIMRLEGRVDKDNFYRHFQELMDSITMFTHSRFKEAQNNPAPLIKLREEVDELIEQMNAPVEAGKINEANEKIEEEFADCFHLLLDSANRFGLSPMDILYITTMKFNKNISRKWNEPNEDGIIKHIEEKLTDVIVAKNKLSDEEMENFQAEIDSICINGTAKFPPEFDGSKDFVIRDSEGEQVSAVTLHHRVRYEYFVMSKEQQDEYKNNILKCGNYEDGFSIEDYIPPFEFAPQVDEVKTIKWDIQKSKQ